jgi:hypothetical protein
MWILPSRKLVKPDLVKPGLTIGLWNDIVTFLKRLSDFYFI